MKSIFQRPAGHFLILFALLSCMCFPLITIADELEPELPPEATASYSMNDLYNRLATGAEGT